QWELVLAYQAVRHPDFAEGIRAMVIDKDYQPRWQHAAVTEVPRRWTEELLQSPWNADNHPLRELPGWQRSGAASYLDSSAEAPPVVSVPQCRLAGLQLVGQIFQNGHFFGGIQAQPAERPQFTAVNAGQWVVTAGIALQRRHLHQIAVIRLLGLMLQIQIFLRHLGQRWLKLPAAQNVGAQRRMQFFQHQIQR